MNLDNSKEGRISVREITDYGEFLDISDAWNAVLASQSRHSVFLTFEWMDSAWQWRKSDSELRVLRYDVQGCAVSIAPFCICNKTRRLVSFKELSLIEIPDSQECDVLAAAGREEDAIRTFLKYLSEKSDWDIAALQKLEASSNLLQHLPALIDETRMRWVTNDAGENQEIVLAGMWGDYYATRSRRLKKGNNNIRNKIKSAAKHVQVRWLGPDGLSEKQAEEVARELRRVSGESWKKSTRLTLDEEGPGAFLDRICQYARENSWLSYWDLKLDEDVVATELQLNYQGTVVALRADYDPKFSKLSPGTYLNWQIIESLFSTDCVLYRMGPGSNEYKLRWSEQATALREIRLYNTTIKGFYLWIADTKVVPVLRRVFSSLSRAGKSLVSAFKPGR